MIVLGTLIMLMLGMVVFSYLALRTIFSLAVIFSLGIAIMIPFLLLIHPWFELVIVVLLIMIITSKTKTVNPKLNLK